MLPSNKSNKTRNKGILDAINEGFLTGLLTFVEEVRDNKNVASTSLITLQLIMKTLKLTVVGFVPLHHCPLQL
jgi:hypothetical protein